MKFKIGENVLIHGRPGVIEVAHVTITGVCYDVRQPDALIVGVAEAEISLSEVEVLRREVARLTKAVESLRSSSYRPLDQIKRQPLLPRDFPNDKYWLSA